MLILLDNTVLSNFAIVRRADLLHTALEKAATVPQVLNEFHAGTLNGRVPPVDWSWLSIIDLTTEEQSLFTRIALPLNDGEAACLAVAVSRRGQIITDDRDAREVAADARVGIWRHWLTDPTGKHRHIECATGRPVAWRDDICGVSLANYQPDTNTISDPLMHGAVPKPMHTNG